MDRFIDWLIDRLVVYFGLERSAQIEGQIDRSVDQSMDVWIDR